MFEDIINTISALIPVLSSLISVLSPLIIFCGALTAAYLGFRWNDRSASKRESAPYIVCYFEPKDHFIYLIIENVGKGLAKDIKLDFNPKLQCHYEISDTPLIRDGIPSMPPNFKIRTYFSDSPTYLNSGLPLSYNVKITYKGTLDTEIKSTEHIVDLNFIKGIHFVGQNTMHDLVNEIKEIRKIHQKILDKIDKKK